MGNFTNWFEKVDIPSLGLVRFPEVTLSPEERVRFGLGQNDDPVTVLKKLVWQSAQKLLKEGKFKGFTEEEVIKQLKIEFETFAKTGIHQYLILVWDICRWADEQGIVRGWGRGSAAGSLSLYCLNITKVNPLKHKLNFLRFVSEARLEPVIIDGVVWVQGLRAPDIDLDFQYGRRDEVVAYIERKYSGRTSKIATRLGLTSKTALKNVLKLYNNYSEDDALRVTSFIEPLFGRVPSLTETRFGGKSGDKPIPPNQDILEWLQKNPKNEEIWSVALAIEGLNTGKGQHPSGVLVSFFPLEGYIPTELAKEKGDTTNTVSSFDMEIVSTLALKIDALSVRSLDLVADTAKEAGIKVDDMDLDDPSISEFVSRPESHFAGLFQIEDGSTKDATIKVGPKNIDDLGACLAISRPGALKYLDKYARYVRTGEFETIHPQIDEVLKSTGNVLVFQEQITESCREVFKFTDVAADTVRAAVGKKDRDKMAKYEEELYKKGKEHNIPESAVKYFWNVCASSADYLFVKCLHSSTIVQTPYGHKLMKDIVVGEKVKAYDVKSATNHFVTVVSIIPGKTELFEFTLRSGYKITASMEHKVLCSDLVMRPFSEIVEDQWNTKIVNEIDQHGRKIETLDFVHAWKSVGIQETLDFEVDHEDHNFYANGVVVSNSHAVSYAYLTAATIFLKSHYPKQFYLTMLRLAKEEPDPVGYIKGVIAEAKLAGTSFLQPDIFKSEADFSLQPDENKNTGIRFGLSHLRGVSDSAMESLASFKSKTISSKLDLFDAARSTGIDIRVLTTLISSGCLSWGSVPRTKLVLEANVYHVLTDLQKAKIKRLAVDFDHDLLATLKALPEKRDEKGKPIFPERQIDSLRKKVSVFWEIYKQNSQNEELTAYLMERACMGFSYSGNLHNIYKKMFPGLVSLDEAKAKGQKYKNLYQKAEEEAKKTGKKFKYPANEYVNVVAFVTETKSAISQKNASPYLKIYIEDDSNNSMVMVYGAEKLDLCKSFNGRYPEEDDLILVQGNMSKDGTSIFADSVIIQKNVVASKKSVVSEVLS